LFAAAHRSEVAPITWTLRQDRVMALKDAVALGMSLPHRSPDPIPAAVVREVAGRADKLGFQDLWVTNNTVDEVGCFDSWTVLTYAAALTTRIRLGVSVMVLPTYHPVHVAQVVSTVDHLSGGRATLGVGLGRVEEYGLFQVPAARRVRRLTESIELIRALWAGDHVTFDGEIYRARGANLGTRPVQRPGPPIWLGSHHPDALRRAARLGDGWMAAGGATGASFAAAVPRLRGELVTAGRDPGRFPISKRVFVSVDDRPSVARAELERWFAVAYRNPDLTDEAGVHGTPDEVGEQLADLVEAGATHLLLNPVSRYGEQLEALAGLTGLV
jgi:probable F420-dependent oxidoreductase